MFGKVRAASYQENDFSSAPETGGKSNSAAVFFSNIFSAPVRSVDDEDLLSFKHL